MKNSLENSQDEMDFPSIDTIKELEAEFEGAEQEAKGAYGNYLKISAEFEI